MNKVSAHFTIRISTPIEKLWDYTQNWGHRTEWDRSVLEVISQLETPTKKIRARFQGGLVFDIQYKLNERPTKTTLVMTNSNSRFILGGGGSWRYESADGNTLWTQTNTLVLGDYFLMRMLRPIFGFALRWSTSRAMKRAKIILENKKGRY